MGRYQKAKTPLEEALIVTEAVERRESWEHLYNKMKEKIARYEEQAKKEFHDTYEITANKLQIHY